MFDIVTSHRKRLCDGSSRRDFLRAGLFGGLGSFAIGRRGLASDPAKAGPFARDNSKTMTGAGTANPRS